MYSYYVLRHTQLVNNRDTVTDCWVLNDRDDLLAVLSDLDVNPTLTESCLLWVYRSGSLDATFDFLPAVPDEQDDDLDEFAAVAPDLAGVDLPALTDPVLPPGHPVDVDGEPRHFGLTVRYC
ncbi:hypothetical protein Daura_23445 [Dactylosporangium aurantiacum]|uniref:Uncharacterized protein n=1 Tax=Dactylosporangium aurantiacum TaxID=35754 RepID=A0A9Q9IS03_9ACTN|nr:hypothetical protein [Dactylosporangium aurantiacum]MDG6103957.1 hypothetical protein [Dactylosporangium aurantiacum]UWZ58865.1 hypothetical protein Daura_23445 [Dactylosporangium aurantiacum]